VSEQIMYKKDFYRKLMLIAIPVSFQNVTMSMLNYVDTLMIGQLGDNALASVAIGNQLYFLLMLFTFGLASGCSIFTAQYWGVNDNKSIKKVTALCLALALSMSMIFFLIAVVFPVWFSGIFTNDADVIGLSKEYLIYAGISYPFFAVSMVISIIIRSTNKIRISVVSSLIGLSLNTFLNYCLIFGHCHFPELGVKGAAIATTIARVVEFLVLIIIVYKKKYVASVSFKDLLSVDLKFFKKIIHTIYPVLLNEMVWSLGIAAYNVCFGRIGTESLASINIAMTVDRMAFAFIMSISSAGAVIIGNEIGRGNRGLVDYYTVKTLKISVIISLVFTASIIFFRNEILSYFAVSSSVLKITGSFLLVSAIILPVKAFNNASIIAILRSGGDTRYSFYLEAGTMWLIGVPAAFIAGHYFFLSPVVVLSIIQAEEIIKALLCYLRIRSGKWVNKVSCNIEMHNIAQEHIEL